MQKGTHSTWLRERPVLLANICLSVSVGYLRATKDVIKKYESDNNPQTCLCDGERERDSRVKKVFEQPRPKNGHRTFWQASLGPPNVLLWFKNARIASSGFWPHKLVVHELQPWRCPHIAFTTACSGGTGGREVLPQGFSYVLELVRDCVLNASEVPRDCLDS